MPGKRTLVGARYPVQARRASDPPATDGEEVHGAAQAGVAGSAASLPYLDQIQTAFGPHDVGGIGAHVGGAAAEAAGAIGAEAYATGDQVAFASSPDLHTAAHEAAHVVQQRGGVSLKGGVGEQGDAHERHADAVADRVVAGRSAADLLSAHGGDGGGGGGGVVQRRRLPTNAGALLSDPGNAANPGANYAAQSAGMKRLIAQAVPELTLNNLTHLQAALGSTTWRVDVQASNDPQFIARVSDAIRAERPDLSLGDPALIDVAPGMGSLAEGNLTALVASANALFDAVAGGGHDAALTNVFGAGNLAGAKARYAHGKTWMNQLAGTRMIVSDTSGYSGEIGVGGLTQLNTKIQLAPTIISSPGSAESKVTLLHESMHAGNADVLDHGYIHQPSFTTLPEATKLGNAAHYEVVPRQILGAGHAFAGVVFTPAGAPIAGGGGAVAPPLTDAEQTIRQTSEAFRMAWTYALNLHILFRQVYNTPADWTRDLGGGKQYATSLPYWSKVMKASTHLKAAIDPASADPARLPVSQIDMAIIEGVTRKLAMCMGQVPPDELALTTLEDAHLSLMDRSVARISVGGRKQSLMKLVLEHGRGTTNITGDAARDYRVVDALATLNWATVTDARDPASFID